MKKDDEMWKKLFTMLVALLFPYLLKIWKWLLAKLIVLGRELLRVIIKFLEDLLKKIRFIR